MLRFAQDFPDGAIVSALRRQLSWTYLKENICKRIREDSLHEQQAGYGEQIVQTLSAQLTEECGCGFDRRNLFHLTRFAEAFPDEAIANALGPQMSWPAMTLDNTLHDSIRRARQRLAVTKRQRDAADDTVATTSPKPRRTRNGTRGTHR